LTTLNFKKKKGSAFIWLVSLLAIFAIGTMYIIFAQPFGQIFTSVNESLSAIPASKQQVDFQPTLSKIVTIWKFWPLLFIFGMILWAVFWSIRRSPENEGFV